MKLQILIPHYKETFNEIKPLLDSIAIQQSVDFNEIGVIICHDGVKPRFLNDGSGRQPVIQPKDTIQPFYFNKMGLLSDYEQTDIYPFKIEQIWLGKHGGVSATRNACLDYATADYVMFCDADDMFMNVCGLYIIFNEFDKGFDSLLSVFVEESRHPQTKDVVYINHDMDSTFVHGKVHRRQYLIDNNIRFNDKLTIHEDSYFNILAQNLTKEVKYCQVPFYLWKWRDNSVCRHDPKYILKTYNNMLDSNDALIDNFLSRGRQDKAMFYAVMMTFDAYYTMNKPEWINQENQEYRNKTERRFKRYFLKHEDLWDMMPVQDKMQISNQIRGRSINEGMQMEAVTIDGWLKHVKKLK